MIVEGGELSGICKNLSFNPSLHNSICEFFLEIDYVRPLMTFSYS